MNGTVEQLEPSFVERVWGSRSLAPLFPPQPVNIGEVWFHAGEDHPLLVKFLFTREKLSVQVHPPDHYAAAHGGSRGKTEMWHILAAEPGARIALGFKETLTQEQLRSGIEDGSVERMLNWIAVHPGETYFTPAGVVHAIGAGITLCEIQQHSDATYRLYDYGRRRELHIEKALDVAQLGPYDGRRELPVRCPHFITDLVSAAAPVEIANEPETLFIVLYGSGRLQNRTFRPGQVWRVPRNVALEPAEETIFLRTWSPA